MFEYIDSHYNIRPRGGLGVTRIEQVESLVPYLKYFSDLSVDHFWRLCNVRGRFEFRKSHLDPRLTHARYREDLGEADIAKALDGYLEKGHLHMIYHYVERLTEAGLGVDAIMKEFGDWLSARPTLNALRIVSPAVVQVGRRPDLAIMNRVESESKDEAEYVIADATFAVMRRTLH